MTPTLYTDYLLLREAMRTEEAAHKRQKERLDGLESLIIEDMIVDGVKSIRLDTRELFSLTERWSVANRDDVSSSEAALLLIDHGQVELVTINRQRAAALASEGIDLSYALKAHQITTLSVRKG